MQIPADMEYYQIQELCSEQQVIEKNKAKKIYRWTPKNESHPNNHSWDLAVYNRALADIFGVSMLRDPNQPAKKKERTFEKEGDAIRTKY
jgi:phage terminase large subunit GpA-like protein